MAIGEMNASVTIRRPAVAGVFYPESAADLRRKVNRYLRDAYCAGPYPKALIVPHAGYAYSGIVAATGYCLLEPIRKFVRRVVLLGPSHRVSLHGLAASGAAEFETPLGSLAVDDRSMATALKLPQVRIMESAHIQEHCLEVQLPFLQMTLDRFCIVPLVVGNATPEEVREVLEVLWDDTDTLIVVSSDLSHNHSYSAARSLDSETAHLIERCQWRQLDSERACGYVGIGGLLQLAKAYGLRVLTADLQNSGDTTGLMDQVVGYGSFVVY